MDYTFVILTIIQVLIGGIMTIILIRVFLKTRYIPTALLAIFFGLLMCVSLFIIPIFWIPYSGEVYARFLHESSVICFFLMFPFLIMAFEGMKGRIFSPVTALFTAFAAYAIGSLTITPPYTYVFVSGFWWQNILPEFDLMFLTLFLASALAAITIVLFRLFQFVKGKETGRDKRMTIVAISGFLIAMIGGMLLFLLEIPNTDYFSVVIGTAIVAVIYIKYPHSFFLSNTRIIAIMFINSANKIPILTIGEGKSSRTDLAAAGLGGIMMLLQEILEEKRPPTTLFHRDKGILLEHDTINEVSEVLVAEEVNNMLRGPLKHTLSLFTQKFKDELTNWTSEVSIFLDFEEEIRRIFKFALPESDIS